MTRWMLTSAAIAALAGGCAATGPAPVDYRGDGAAAPVSRAPAPIERRSPDQTAVAAAAEIAAPAREGGPEWAAGPGAPLSTYALQPEEAQPYDPRAPDQAHLVQAGETLHSIAAQRQIPLRALIDANDLTPPFAVEPGQVLTLPPPLVHVVASGETVAAIARRYNVDLRSLVLLNRLAPPYAIRPGDRIIAPAGARAAAAAPRPAAAPASSRAPAAAPTGPAPRFMRPADGAVLVSFGVQPNGGRSDGVEIAAAAGAPVRAAGDGVVLYAGSHLDHHGVVVIVSHEGGWVTTYAYAARALVETGARVARGAAIAEAGGAPEGPSRILFQVRRGVDPVDPGPLIGG